MKAKKNILKGAGAILILAVLVFSTTAVYGQNENIKKEHAINLAGTFQPSSIVIKNDPVESRGPILWDNGLPDGRDAVSCVYWPSADVDRYVIDEFYVPEGGWTVGDGHFRIIADSGGGPELLDYVWVYFFYNTGPCEPDYYAYVMVIPDFTAELTGNTYFGRQEILVNCVFDPPVELPNAGEWWVCFQPQMEENCYWLTTTEKECTILVDYPDAGYYRWTYGYSVFGDYYDVSFVLTGVQQCEPSVNIEKYVKDENGVWQDADTPDMAVELPICTDAEFKIVIKNDGDCPLKWLNITDYMHDSLTFISADPEPEHFTYDPPEYKMYWFYPGPLNPDDTIEILLTAHVDGPECSSDYNWVHVGTVCEHGNYVEDDDTAWVHAYKKSREFNSSFLNFLESHPNMFPLLQKLIQRFGL